jgi:RNA-binding protein
MALSNSQIKFLREKAHHLNPVIMVGANGITDGLLEELDATLEHHELIKIRVRAEDRDDKKEIMAKLCKLPKVTKVHVIGHILVLYRPAKKAKLVLPK